MAYGKKKGGKGRTACEKAALKPPIPSKHNVKRHGSKHVGDHKAENLPTKWTGGKC